jgi:hypothetical protein
MREPQNWRSFVRQRPQESWEGKHAGRILRTIDSNITFPFLNFEANVTAAQEPKQHYRLAYILLVHNNLPNLVALIDALADPTVFIYIHVDYSAPHGFQQQVRETFDRRHNIAVMETTFPISWGHMSLLWAQLRAFFDLLDLITFDYVINLSGSDYPLKSASLVYQTLARQPQSNWLDWADDNDWELHYRTENMFHCRDELGGDPQKCYFPHWVTGRRSYDGFADLFPRRYKIRQWLILHRSTVEYLRTSEAVKLLMMYAEHTCVPDEMWLGTILAASPFIGRTYNDAKRLVVWREEAAHPHDWTYRDQATLEKWQDPFLWVRKVDVTGDPRLKEILDGFVRDALISNVTVFRGEVPWEGDIDAY